MAAPLYIVTGFLGSGKTTLLKKLVERYADLHRIGVVQNEFAAISVDAQEILRTGKRIHLLEVNRGSVFCLCLITDFQTSLAQFIDTHHPDVIILEATGLADPIAVAEMFTAPELRQRTFLARIWCIIDASTFLILEKSNLRLTNQVRAADVVLVNKTDLVDDTELEKTEARLRALNPAAELVRTTFCEPAVTLSIGAGILPKLFPHAPLGRPSVGTAVIKSAQTIARAALEQFIAELASDVWRIKGFVNLKEGGAVTVQSVFGNTRVAPLPDYAGLTEMIVIGPKVQHQWVVARFRELVAG